MAKHQFRAKYRARPRRPFDIADDEDEFEILLGTDEKEGLRAGSARIVRSR